MTRFIRNRITIIVTHIVWFVGPRLSMRQMRWLKSHEWSFGWRLHTIILRMMLRNSHLFEMDED